MKTRLATPVLRLYSLVLAAILLLATSAHSREPLVVIITPGLTVHDLSDFPVLDEIASKSSIAYISTRIGRGSSVPLAEEDTDLIASSYMTVATGVRSAVGVSSAEIFNRGERVNRRTVETLYKARNSSLKPEAQIIAPNVNMTRRQTEGSAYPAEFGSLYKALDKKSVAVIGNSDCPGQFFRPIGYYGVGPDGTGQRGIISAGLLAKDRKFPFGVKTDQERFAQALERCSSAAVVFIDCGDMTRFLLQQQFLSEEARAAMRIRVMKHTASMIQAAADISDNVIIVSPIQSIDPRTAGADRLGLLVIQEGSGVLKGSSTRRLAAMANTDVANAILRKAGVADNIQTGDGRAYEQISMSPEESLAEMRKVYSQSQFQANARTGINLFVWVSAVIFLVITLFRLTDTPFRPALSLAGVPATWMLTLLVSSIFTPPLWLLVTSSATAALLIWLLLCRFLGRWSFEALALSSIAAVFTALFSGLFVYAAGSFELQGGARFYGIGNEHAGFLTGAVLYAISAPALLQNRFKQIAGLAVGLAIALALGHPAVGANAGDMLGCLAGVAALAAVTVFRGRIIAFVLLGAVAVGMLIGFAALDAAKPPESQSHIGKALDSFTNAGPQAIVDIAVRKASLNAMLLRNSPWAALLVAGVVGGLFCWQKRSNNREKDAPRVISTGVALVILLIANDSGVLSAAACGLWLFTSCADGGNICEKRLKFV